jgi:hypothetical protein
LKYPPVGTEQLVPPPQILRAGELTAELEGGNLRYIRFGNRDDPGDLFRCPVQKLGHLRSNHHRSANLEQRDSFRIVYQATAKDASQEFRYTAEIVGHADGSLRFHGRGQSDHRVRHQPHGPRRPPPDRRNCGRGGEPRRCRAEILSNLASPNSSTPFSR